MKRESDLEKSLFELAVQLGVGTKNSDICLYAIRKINDLEDEIADLTAKLQRPL